MHHQEPAIGSLALVSVLAFLVPLVLGRIRRIRIPSAAGEILAGILVGRSGFGLIQPSPLLDFFTFLGMASLMFLSGMEVDFDALAGRGRPPKGRSERITRLYHPLILAATIFGLSFYGADRLALWISARGLVKEPLFLTMIIATSGLTLIMPVLKQHDLLSGPFGQVLLNTAVLGDILPLIGLSALAAFRLTGAVINTLSILVLAAAAIAVYWLGKWFHRFNLLEGLIGGTVQITVRASFALMFIFLALADVIGVEAVLGAFAAGLLISTLSGHHQETIAHKLDALGFGFLIPVFFLMVGVQFDLGALLRNREALTMVPLLFAGILLTKAAPAVLLAIWYPLRLTAAGMVLLTTQMSVTIAASTIALQVGAYGASIHAAVVLVVLLTALTGPILFGKIMGPPRSREQHREIILAGMNRLSLLLGKRFRHHGFTVRAIDRHSQRVQEFRQSGITAVQGEPTQVADLRKAGAEDAYALVALTEDEAANRQAARIGLNDLGVGHAIIFGRGPADWQHERLEIINPDLATVTLIEQSLLNPGAAALNRSAEDADLQLADCLLMKGPLVGKALRAVTLPSEILLVAIQRGQERIVPRGHTVLQAGDRLTAVGPPEALHELQALSGAPVSSLR